MQQRIRLVGGREALQAVTTELEKQLVEKKQGGISLGEPHPIQVSLGGRTPYGQIELFDVMIAIGINLASSAIYDLVKAAIARVQSRSSAEIQIDIHFVYDTQHKDADPQ